MRDLIRKVLVAIRNFFNYEKRVVCYDLSAYDDTAHPDSKQMIEEVLQEQEVAMFENFKVIKRMPLGEEVYGCDCCNHSSPDRVSAISYEHDTGTPGVLRKEVQEWCDPCIEAMLNTLENESNYDEE